MFAFVMRIFGLITKTLTTVWSF